MNKEYKYIDYHKGKIPLKEAIETLSTSSFPPLLRQHPKEVLLSFLTKGYQTYLEEINKNQDRISESEVSSRIASLELDAVALQGEMLCTLGISWHPLTESNHLKQQNTNQWNVVLRELWNRLWH